MPALAILTSQGSLVISAINPWALSRPTTNVRIFYKDWGPKDAQPIVFHHGWPLSSDEWDAQMPFFLSKGYRVVAHDRRGHGRSEQVATVTTRQSRRTIASVAWTGIGGKVGEARLVHVFSDLMSVNTLITPAAAHPYM